jgi:hypothetical protein
MEDGYCSEWGNPILVGFAVEMHGRRLPLWPPTPHPKGQSHTGRLFFVRSGKVTSLYGYRFEWEHPILVGFAVGMHQVCPPDRIADALKKWGTAQSHTTEHQSAGIKSINTGKLVGPIDTGRLCSREGSLQVAARMLPASTVCFTLHVCDWRDDLHTCD